MIKKNELLLLSHLRRNARETLTKISRKTRLPISTIYDRLKLQEAELIVKHTSLLDFAKLGFNTRVSIAIKVPRELRLSLEDYLQKHTSVNSLYKINNGYDFMAEGIFRRLKEFQEFIEVLEDKFPGMEKQMYYIVDDMKREEFLSNPDQVDAFLNVKSNIDSKRENVRK